MNNKNIRISLSYTTNFKPAHFLNFKNLQLFKLHTNKNKIISRNFFLFLLLLKYVNKDNTLLNTSIFVKPFFKKFITLLRAPYRHKLSRHQFIMSRYSILYSLSLNFNNIFIKNHSELIFLLKTIKKFYVWFESNIVYQHQAKVLCKLFFINNFMLNGYKFI